MIEPAEQWRRPYGSGRQPEPLEHGTTGGYRKELRRGIRRCDQCRRAMAEYNRRNREKNRNRRNTEGK